MRHQIIALKEKMLALYLQLHQYDNALRVCEEVVNYYAKGDQQTSAFLSDAHSFLTASMNILTSFTSSSNTLPDEACHHKKWQQYFTSLLFIKLAAGEASSSTSILCIENWYHQQERIAPNFPHAFWISFFQFHKEGKKESLKRHCQQAYFLPWQVTF